MKKPRRYAPTVIAEGESSAVPPAPLIIRLSAPRQTTGKAAPDLGNVGPKAHHSSFDDDQLM